MWPQPSDIRAFRIYLDGKVVTTWSTGCLSELHPGYMPVNKWNHGFAVIRVDENGDFEVDNLRIIKVKVR